MVSAAAGREAALAVAGIGLSSALALVAASRPAVTADGAQISGATTPAATSLAFVALAGAAALFFLGPTSRRAVGALLVVVGAGIVIVMLSTSRDYGWSAFGAQAPVATRSVWSWVGAGAGLVLLLCATWTLIRAGSWPIRQGLRRRRGDEQEDGHVAERPNGDSPWDMIDRGEDPTA